ncbi:MAG: peptide chain release factor N(5)-glutamine methyltransferase, partial [Spirulina sp. SIO3F2]|nr:peptide chain release factor N(5)-glutamine methyltransferase [Spirulina sp. SIO3F2]
SVENIEKNDLTDRVTTFEGDLLAALPDDETYDAIVANPPYIPDNEWEAVAANVKDHEPTHALRGGKDGLDFIRLLIAQAPHRLRSGGFLAIEVATARAEEALHLIATDDRYCHAAVVRDFAGRPRVITAKRA